MQICRNVLSTKNVRLNWARYQRNRILPSMCRIALSSWMKGALSKNSRQMIFFASPKTDRAKLFLSQILDH